ncbi:hypothetical protein Taro_013947 [Colocasia esculenta]|uniref:Uncharacterized protein n=1 Tax=Colocasia esculenta TaxID=4460 RepID=A0A843UDB2_COLES|nr:hypothetical protein [Colocasia esculenta]
MAAVCRALGSQLTSVVGSRQPPTLRSGHDVGLRRVLNRCAFLRRFGRTELSQALLDQGSLLRGFAGRFDGLVVVLAWSLREDVVRSGGNTGSSCSSRSWAQSAHRLSAYERDRGMCRVLNATALVVAFLLPLFGGLRLHGCRVSGAGQSADIDSGIAIATYVAIRSRPLLDQGSLLRGFSGRFDGLAVILAWSLCEDVVRSRGNARSVVLVGLHSSLACACGAAVGPFVCDYETERFGGVPCGGTSLVVVSVVVPHGGRYLYPELVLVSRGTLSTSLFSSVTLVFEVSVLVPSDSRTTTEWGEMELDEETDDLGDPPQPNTFLAFVIERMEVGVDAKGDEDAPAIQAHHLDFEVDMDDDIVIGSSTIAERGPTSQIHYEIDTIDLDWLIHPRGLPNLS